MTTTTTFAVRDTLLPTIAQQYTVMRRHEVIAPSKLGRDAGVCPNCGGDRELLVWSGEPQKDQAGKPRPPSTRFAPSGKQYHAWLVSVPCPACALGEKGAYRRLLQQRSGVPASQWGVTMSALRDIPAQIPMRKIVAGALADPFEPVMAGFFGGYGVGKTWHLYALVNGCTAMGLPALYATQSQYLNRLRATFDDGGERTAVVLKDYIDARVLCLDEVGTNVELTGWAAEQVRELLTRRADAGAGVTLLAGNVVPEKLGAEWGWLSSRLRGRLIAVHGADLRGQ